MPKKTPPQSRETVRRLLERVARRCRFDARHVTLLDYSARTALPRVAPQEHAHETGELALSFSGPLFCQVSGGPLRRFRPRQLVLIPAGLSHVSLAHLFMKFARRGHTLTVGLAFGEAFVMEYRNGEACSVSLTAEEKREWTALLGYDPGAAFRKAVAALKRDGAWRDAYLDGLFKLFLSSLAAAIRPEAKAARRTPEGIAPKAVAFICAHYANPALRLRDIAAAVGLTPHYFAALFSRATGTTAWRTLVETRLAHARGLLTGSRFTIKEIATLTGWNNQLYFSHAFRRRFGLSPTECRAGRAIRQKAPL